MSHSTEIVAFKKLSSGKFSLVVRCCGNASTDWPHEMTAEDLANDEKRFASISKARQDCSDLHEAAMQAELKLINEVSALPVEHL